MSADPPHPVYPLRLAKTGEVIEGDIRFDEMQRLTGLLLDYTGKLHYKLSFNYDDSGQCYIESEIKACLTMECQRCLEPFSFELNKQSKLGVIVSSDYSKSLDSYYEPVILDEEKLELNGLVEDELLLAMPLAPLHLMNDCPGQAELKRINAEARLKPFSVLSKLMKSKDN